MALRLSEASDSLLRRLGSLRRETNRRRERVLRVEGRRVFLAALATGWRPEAVVTANPEGLPAGLPLFVAPAPALARRLAQRRLDPLVALGPLPDRQAPAAAGTATLVVLAVQDPGNLGAILRTAAGLGVGGALLLPGCPDPFNPRVVHASAGAVLSFPVAMGEEADPAGAGRVVLCAHAQGGAPPPYPPPERWALVLGHETRGLPEPWGERGLAVTLPTRLESLGVAASAAILMDRLTGGAAAAI